MGYTNNSGSFIYDTLVQGNFILPYMAEHERDIIKKLSDNY